MRYILPLLIAPAIASADPRVEAALDDHVLPGLAALTAATGALAASDSCDVKAEWNAATAAWMAVAHLRFGPAEVDNRAFSLAFWPDPRGTTPKSLFTLLSDDAPAIADASVAGRGFYALEFMLYDEQFADVEGRCNLIAGLASDVHATATALERDWLAGYADLMRSTGNDVYRSNTEALQELYKAVTTGLEFNADMRLGRPLGTFDRPRPNRAEMRRSARSLENVAVSMASITDLMLILSAGGVEDPKAAFWADLSADLREDIADIEGQIENIANQAGGGDFSLVSDLGQRVKVEALQRLVVELRQDLSLTLGPELGVIEGFNALDGD